MFNATQGFDALFDGFNAGIQGLHGVSSEFELQRQYMALVHDYNALVERYNELLGASHDATSRLQAALQQARDERDALRVQNMMLRAR